MWSRGTPWQRLTNSVARVLNCARTQVKFIAYACMAWHACKGGASLTRHGVAWHGVAWSRHGMATHCGMPVLGCPAQQRTSSKVLGFTMMAAEVIHGAGASHTKRNGHSLMHVVAACALSTHLISKEGRREPLAPVLVRAVRCVAPVLQRDHPRHERSPAVNPPLLGTAPAIAHTNTHTNTHIKMSSFVLACMVAWRRSHGIHLYDEDGREPEVGSGSNAARLTYMQTYDINI